MGFPEIPRTAFSLLGPVQVRHEALGEDDCGDTDLKLRSMKLHEPMAPGTKWSSYWHECTHLALFDSGTRLSEEDEERVCDAIGTYLAAAVRSGFLRVHEPEKETP